MDATLKTPMPDPPIIGNRILDPLTSKSPPQPYQCDRCSSSFKRQEHLKRHQTQHSRSKAFSCRYCSKAFSRIDVLNRHYSSCKAAKADNNLPDASEARRKGACKPCRKAKVKCGGIVVCQRCKNLGIMNLCIIPPRLHKVRESTAQPSHERTESSQPGGSSPVSGRIESDDGFTGRTSTSPNRALESLIIPLPREQGRRNTPAVDTIFLGDPVDGPLSTVRGDVHDNVDTLSMLGVFNDEIADTSFTLSALDYSMIDSFLHSQTIDSSMVYTSEGWDTEQTVSFDPFPIHINDDLDMLSRHQHLPTGLNLMQFSPLESHWNTILQYLKETKQCSREQLAWLSLDNMNLFLWCYFAHCHQHTPFLHLPSWNISTASTRLIFAMTLMGAMYSGDLATHGKQSRKLCVLAETYAWETDPQLSSNGIIMLDTIQAIYLLTLLDGFYFQSTRHSPKIDLKRLLTAVRSAGLFEKSTYAQDPWSISWQQWAVEQSRLRTAFIVYLYGVVRAIFFDERPELHLYQLRLPLPCHESTFAEADEDKWRESWSQSSDLTRLDYSIILSVALSHKPLHSSLNFSVMGTFIILHGILLSVWEGQQIASAEEQRKIASSPDRFILSHLASVYNETISNALAFWLEHWNKTLSNPLTSPSSGLYRDRAVMYWFLCMLWNRQSSSQMSKSTYQKGPEDNSWTLRVPRLMKKMIMVFDQNPTQLKGLELPPCFWDIDEEDSTGANSSENETMDTITVDFLLQRNATPMLRENLESAA